jgi:hypothetical protein
MSMLRLAGMSVAGALGASIVMLAVPQAQAAQCVAPPAISKKCAEWKCTKQAWCTTPDLLGMTGLNGCLKWTCNARPR